MNESGKKLRVLMLINSGRMGGLERHMRCLAKCLGDLRITGPFLRVMRSFKFDVVHDRSGV